MRNHNGLIHAKGNDGGHHQERALTMKLFWLSAFRDFWEVVLERSDWNAVFRSYQYEVLKKVQNGLRVATMVDWSENAWDSASQSAVGSREFSKSILLSHPELWLPRAPSLLTDADREWLGIREYHELAAKLILPLMFPDDEQGTVVKNGKLWIASSVDVRFFIDTRVDDVNYDHDPRMFCPVLRIMPLVHSGVDASHPVMQEQIAFLCERANRSVKPMAAELTYDHVREIEFLKKDTEQSLSLKHLYVE